MSSKFLPSTTPRNTPPWCYPGLYPVLPPIIDGQPQYVVAYLTWYDPDPIVLADHTASVKLAWNAAANEWSFDQPGPGLSLGGTLKLTTPPDLYTMSLRLNWDGSSAEEHEWENIKIGPDFPWDSGLQTWSDGDQQMQVTV